MLWQQKGCSLMMELYAMLIPIPIDLASPELERKINGLQRTERTSRNTLEYK